MTKPKASSPSQPPLVVEQIKRQLRARIGTQWRIGDRLPPIDELAREMGVGEKNAYQAVRALSLEGLLASRPRHGTYVSDRPKPQTPAKRARHVVQLPLGPDRDGMIQRMARAFTQEMQRRGREVIIGPDPTDITGHMDLTGIDADAVVLLNMGTSKITAPPGLIFAILDSAGQTPPSITRRYDVVGPDNEQGGMLAGECLRQFGVNGGEIAFVGVGDRSAGYRTLDAARLDGFERGLGQPVSASSRFYVDSYSESCGAAFAAEYGRLSSRPRAMFFSTDDIAAGFAIGAVVLGLEPRRDFLAVGFDGQSRARNVVFGGLTTVAVPVEAMGRQAAEFLDMRLDHPDLPPRSISLGCAVRRGKTTPIPTGPQHPFWNDAAYWPNPLEHGDTQ